MSIPLNLAWGIVVIVPFMACFFGLSVWQWRSMRAFERQVAGMSRLGWEGSIAVRARLSLMWMTALGGLVFFGGVLPWAVPRVLGDPAPGQGWKWVTLACVGVGVVLILLSQVCAWSYWPRWTVPPHQRDQPSPYRQVRQQRRERRQRRAANGS